MAEPLRRKGKMAEPLLREDKMAEPLRREGKMAEPLRREGKMAEPLRREDKMAEPLCREGKISPNWDLSNNNSGRHIDLYQVFVREGGREECSCGEMPGNLKLDF